MPGHHVLNRIFGYQAQPMRARRDQQRRIIGIDWIEMEAHGHHAFQQRDGRRDMRPSLLHGPWPETLDIAPFNHLDGPVLMPGQRPIRVVTLIEQHRPNRAHRRSLIGDQPSDPGQLHHPPGIDPLPRTPGRPAVKQRGKLDTLTIVQPRRPKGIALFFQRHAQPIGASIDWGGLENHTGPSSVIWKQSSNRIPNLPGRYSPGSLEKHMPDASGVASPRTRLTGS